MSSIPTKTQVFSLNKAYSNSYPNSTKKLKKACEEFESFFIYYLLKVMRKTVPKNKLFDSGLTTDIYTSMLDEALANKIGQAGGIGLTKLFLKEFESNQKIISSEQAKFKADSILKRR